MKRNDKTISIFIPPPLFETKFRNSHKQLIEKKNPNSMKNQIKKKTSINMTSRTKNLISFGY